MDEVNHQPPQPGSVAVILPAAGSGRRFGSHRNKLFAQLANKPLWYHAAARLRECALVGRIVMPVSGDDRSLFESEFKDQVDQLQIEITLGGTERTDSVKSGLDHLGNDPAIQWVAVHDAARPLVSQTDLFAVFAAASQTGAAILATPMAGTVKRLSRDQDCTTVDRSDLWIALTPQVFDVDVLRNAYEKYRGRPATDDAELVERTGNKVSIVKGSADNLKITLPEDLLLAQAILTKQTDHA